MKSFKPLLYLLPYLWPKDNRNFRVRFILAICFLVLAKLANVSVPIFLGGFLGYDYLGLIYALALIYAFIKVLMPKKERNRGSVGRRVRCLYAAQVSAPLSFGTTFHPSFGPNLLLVTGESGSERNQTLGAPEKRS